MEQNGPNLSANFSWLEHMYSALRLYLISACIFLMQLFRTHTHTIPRIKSRSLSTATVIISGTSSGIGQYLAEIFVQQGASVIALTHHLDILPTAWAQVPTDLSSLASVRAAIKTLFQIMKERDGDNVDVDNVILVHCAGVLLPPYSRIATDPADYAMMVNFMGPAYLTLGLSNLISRVVWLGSAAQHAAPDLWTSDWREVMSPYKSYPLSKALLPLFAEAWSLAELKPSIVIHPGVVYTNLYKNEHSMVGALLRQLLRLLALNEVVSAQRVYATLEISGSLAFGQVGSACAHSEYWDAVTLQKARLPRQVRGDARRRNIANKLYADILEFQNGF